MMTIAFMMIPLSSHTSIFFFHFFCNLCTGRPFYPKPMMNIDDPSDMIIFDVHLIAKRFANKIFLFYPNYAAWRWWPMNASMMGYQFCIYPMLECTREHSFSQLKCVYVWEEKSFYSHLIITQIHQFFFLISILSYNSILLLIQIYNSNTTFLSGIAKWVQFARKNRSLNELETISECSSEKIFHL